MKLELDYYSHYGDLVAFICATDLYSLEEKIIALKLLLD